MWIKSQDKLSLVNANIIKIYYIQQDKKYAIISDNCILEDKLIPLGIYSSKEKATKVLDMMGKHLQKIRNADLMMNSLVSQNNINVKEYMKSLVEEPSYVFYMPKIDEVENE